MGRERPPACSTATSWLTRPSEQQFETLSGGQQARFQILLLELSGATMLLLDEPTDNLDVQSAEALEEGLAAFEGTVVAVTHDRWFARGFDRFVVFGADGAVYESDEPVWHETGSSAPAEASSRARRSFPAREHLGDELTLAFCVRLAIIRERSASTLLQSGVSVGWLAEEEK